MIRQCPNCGSELPPSPPKPKTGRPRYPRPSEALADKQQALIEAGIRACGSERALVRTCEVKYNRIRQANKRQRILTDDELAAIVLAGVEPLRGAQELIEERYNDSTVGRP